MVKVVGIRFRNAGKIYYFGPGKLQLKAGMHAIVETARGVEMGTVMTDPREVSEESVVQPLKPVIRIATEQDEKQAEKNRQKEKEAFKICLEKIAKHKLDMKLVEAEYTFDNNKLLFYFTADGRIDFRELVKDLAAVFRTRSVSAMRQRLWEDMESVDVNCAVTHSFPSLHRYQSKWRRSRIFP